MGLNPSIAVGAFDDLVGDELLILLDHRVVVAAPDQALDGEQGIDRIGDGLTLGWQANKLLAIFGKGHDRWRRVHTLGIF